MIASIQEMSSTNTQQLRVSSRRASRTRRSWQRRGLAILVVSTYLLQCATAHEEDLRRLLNKTRRSDPARRGLLTCIAKPRHITDITFGFAEHMEEQYKNCIKDELIGTYVYTDDDPVTYTINNKRCTKCKQRADDGKINLQGVRGLYCRNCFNRGQCYDLEDAPKAYIKRIEAFTETNRRSNYEDNDWDADWGIFDSDDVLHFWSNDDSLHGDCPPNRGWKAYEYDHDYATYSHPETQYQITQNEQVAEYIELTGMKTYEAPSSSSSESYERVECVSCGGSGSNWYWGDCSYCDGDGYNLE